MGDAKVPSPLPGKTTIEKVADEPPYKTVCTIHAMSSRLVPLGDLDARLIGMVLTRSGELADTGAGAAALGDPVAVVAWLANTLGEMGGGLAAGQLVMTGALHAAVPMRAGDVFRAEFDRLGPVTVRVVD